MVTVLCNLSSETSQKYRLLVQAIKIYTIIESKSCYASKYIFRNYNRKINSKISIDLMRAANGMQILYCCFYWCYNT